MPVLLQICTGVKKKVFCAQPVIYHKQQIVFYVKQFLKADTNPIFFGSVCILEARNDRFRCVQGAESKCPHRPVSFLPHFHSLLRNLA